MQRFLGLLALLIMLVAACGPETAVEPAVGEAADDACAPAPGGATLMQHEAYGYCFHYPAGYEARSLAENTVEIAPAGAEAAVAAAEPQMVVKVTAANGRSAQEAADDFFNQIADEVVAEFGIERETAVVDGVTAQVIDNAPEQNVSRYLFLVQNDRLYTLTFLPADAAEMEDFYREVLDSFHFTQ